jgi:acetolactate decarboxylase
MTRWIWIALFGFMSCSKTDKSPELKTIDTDFSKGRLKHQQVITLSDVEKFHGHLCDGLVVGFLATKEAMKVLYPNQPIDRTNLRIVSKPSPCLTDVAIYLSGGRYQFHTFYVDTTFEGLFIIQRIDNLHTVSISIKPEIKPTQIDSMGILAIQQNLSPCEIDELRLMEDDFTRALLRSDPNTIFSVSEVEHFEWDPKTKNDYIKTDIVNKHLPDCN